MIPAFYFAAIATPRAVRGLVTFAFVLGFVLGLMCR